MTRETLVVAKQRCWRRVVSSTVTTIVVLQLGVIGHDVLCHHDFIYLRRSYHAPLSANESHGALPPERGGRGGLHHQGFERLPSQSILELVARHTRVRNSLQLDDATYTYIYTHLYTPIMYINT